MSPNLSDRLSVDQKIARILDLGIPIKNIEVHPDCEPDAPRELILKREREYGFKMLGSFVGTDVTENLCLGKARTYDRWSMKLQTKAMELRLLENDRLRTLPTKTKSFFGIQ